MLNLPVHKPSCVTCGLAGTKQIWGAGTPGGLVIVGEAPGQEELRQGKPAVGQSSTMLRKCLEMVGVDIEKIFFTNACLCRPPQNRTPSQHEISCCNARLISEVLAASPTKVLLLGSTATQAFFGEKITKLRGQYRKWNGIDVLSTYHPSFVLRNPGCFKDLMDDLEKLKRDPCPLIEPTYQVLESGVDVVFQLIKYEQEKLPVSLDIETSSYSPYKDRFLCTGLANNPFSSFIIEAGLLENQQIRKELEEFSHAMEIVAHNGQFEYRWHRVKHRIRLKIGFDTMLAHHTLDERTAEGGYGGAAHDLKTLGGYFYDLPHWDDVMAPYRGDFSLAPKDILYKYLAYDLSTTWRLRDPLMAKLKEQGCWEVYQNIILPALHVLGEMSVTGIMMDWPYLCKYLEQRLERRIERETKVLEGRIKQAGISLGVDKKGNEVNLNVRSSTQMKKLFYSEEGLALPPVKRHGLSTGKKAIKDLERLTKNEIVVKIGTLRKRQHALSAFCLGLQELIQDDGRIHTMYLQHVAETGRLVSRNPNLQNQPNHFGYGKLIRDAYMATPGWKLLDVDYKQLEFRMAAVVTRDSTLIDYIKQNRDIHSEQASLYFDTPISQVTKDQRHDAKRVVFGVFFRRGPWSVSQEYDIPLDESKRRFQILFDTCPGILEYFAETDRTIRKQGYVTSLYGRRRRFALLTKDNAEECGRQAVNHPIQSTASDFCLSALIRISKLLDSSIARPLLTIHDGLVFEIREEHFDRIAKLIKEQMEIPPPFDSPVDFKVDMTAGYRWGSLEKYECQ